MKDANDKVPQFTPKQIGDWVEFEEVRSSGRFNMFDPRARTATGLTTEEYLFVTRNYSALKKAAQPIYDAKVINVENMEEEDES